VETNVHYPTDINLLLDALRKVIYLTARLCKENELTDWRQYEYNLRCLKKLMRRAQNKKQGKARSEERKLKKEREIKEAHQNYISSAQVFLEKAKSTLLKIHNESLTTEIKKAQIEHFISHAERQINQIERRVILEQEIPHEEKVFSIFEPHTEWVVKGKAGVPQELGVRVGLMEDHCQFVLYHHVMEKQCDKEIAVDITRGAKKRFPNLFQVSYDKGFHSPRNQEELKEELTRVILPRKGKLSRQARSLENQEDFLKARRQHSGVESVINALEIHGLDICPDHGIKGFKAYVALAIVGYNVGRLGAILKEKEQKRLMRYRQRFREREPVLKLAA
jgi:transposase, IS5 family